MNPEPTAPPLRWGIVGPGAIAEVFAHAVERAGAGRVAAVFGRSAERAAHFAHRHGARLATDLADVCRGVDALYVATPHSGHAAAVRAGLEQGVAVLCEKPMTTSAEATRELVGLAEARGGLLVEAWMYRTHPQIARAEQLVRDGAIGSLRTIHSAFGFTAPFDAGHRLWAGALGGGAILDIGGYPLSLALLFANASGHRDTADRDTADRDTADRDTAGRDTAHLGFADVAGALAPTGVDAFARATLRWDGLTAHLQCAIDRDLARTATLVGEHGRIVITDPFLPEGRRDGRIGELLVTSDGSEHKEHVAAPHDCFAAEALAMAALVQRQRAGERRPAPPPPMVTNAESLQIATLADRWRRAVAAAAERDSDAGTDADASR